MATVRGVVDDDSLGEYSLSYPRDDVKLNLAIGGRGGCAGVDAAPPPLG